MERAEILATLTKIIEDKLAIDPSLVTEDAHLNDTLGADSLDKVELAMNVEEEFGITVEDDEGVAVITVGDMVNLIEKKIDG